MLPPRKPWRGDQTCAFEQHYRIARIKGWSEKKFKQKKGGRSAQTCAPWGLNDFRGCTSVHPYKDFKRSEDSSKEVSNQMGREIVGAPVCFSHML